MADPKNKWSQPAAQPAPMFFGKKERELVKQVNDELAERVIGQAVAYYPISLEESNFNTTYGEAVEKVALPPIRVYAYVVVENEQSNEKYGYEYTNKLTVNFHRARLTADQDLYVRVGDYVQYGEKFYEIVKTYNDTRYLFGQVEHKFQISAECVEARPGAFRVEKELTRPAALSGSSADTSGPAPRSAPYPPLDATYITVAADPKLPNERVLTAGAGITLTDAGPGGAMTIAALAGSTAGGIFTQVDASNAYTTSSVTVGSSATPTHTLTIPGTMSGSGVATFASSISSSGDMAITGAYHGDGQYLTNISADGVDVTSSTADINYPMVFTEGFQTDGSLGLAGNTAFIYNPSDNVISSSAALQVVGNSIIVGTLNVSGNVGIGTDAPSAGATLEVAGTTAFPDPAVRITGTGPKLQFDESDAGAGKFQIAASNGMLKWQVQNAAFNDASVKWMMNSDGQMAFRDGAAGEAIPARIYISGSGDSNLLQLSSSAAADILVVTGSGRVGIGTATPSDALHISATDAAVRIQKSDSTNTHSDIVMGGNGLYLYSRADTADGIFSFNGFGGGSATEFMRINGAGNVGIGAATPGALLHVSGTQGSLFQIDALSGSVGTVLYVSGGASGYVGIGTSAPSAPLHITGNLDPALLIEDGNIHLSGTNASHNPEIQFIDNSGIDIAGLKIRYDNSSGNSHFENMFNNANRGIIFTTRATDLGGDDVLALIGDRAGIGTTSPSHTLTVAGDISGAVGITGSSGIFDVQVSSSAFHGNTAYFSSDVQIAGTLIGGSPLKISGALDIVDDLGNVISGLGTSTFSSSAGAMFVQAISSSSDLAVSGNLHATTYYGDGSNLTGIDSASGSARQYSTTGMETSGYLRVSGSTTLAGGVIHGRTAVTTTNYTILVTDYYIGANSTSNVITLTLPAAAAAGAGKTYVVKDEGGAASTNSITVDGNGSETVDGVTTVDISSPYGALNLYTDGANWFIY